MENRIRKLDKLCRLCGSKIMLKLGYITAKRCSDYSDVLHSNMRFAMVKITR